MSSTKKAITANQNIIDMEYAVRGPIAARAAEMVKEGRDIIPCHIGNPQALGQTPISYFRQVLGFLENPVMIERERQIRRVIEELPNSEINESDILPEEILGLCEEILIKSKTGLGAYTESKGFYFIREAIADFINRRDQVLSGSTTSADPNKIFLTSGASQGVKSVLDILITCSTDGIMIPIPQYPLYSAAIKKAGGVQVDYYPDEERGWIFDRPLLEESYNRATVDGVNVKAIVVINPANPTGAVLDEICLNEVVSFAREHNLLIIADEVYQENVYQGSFKSFARAVGEELVPLVSLHSISKGFYGECGHRGGYLELRNPPRINGTEYDFTDILNKQASISLCSNTPGQILTYLMVRPPSQNTGTRKKYLREKEQILQNLYNNAVMIRAAFKEMKGVECFGETGAMYLFPRLSSLPENTTDFDYCMALLEETGLCTVNGSGFGQKENTHHLRIAFLPPRETLQKILPAWIDFHNQYVSKR